MACDVAVAQECQALVDATLDAYGRLDFAHNNAGIDHSAPIVDTDDADFERVLRVNLWGVFSGMKAQIPAMIRTGGGAIVNTSSLAGLVGAPPLGAYVASKHAVLGLTKTAAKEYAEHGHPRERHLPGGRAHRHHRQAAAGDPRRRCRRSRRSSATQSRRRSRPRSSGSARTRPRSSPGSPCQSTEEPPHDHAAHRHRPRHRALDRLRARVERDIEEERYDGAVLIVARHGEIGLHEAIGVRAPRHRPRGAARRRLPDLLDDEGVHERPGAQRRRSRAARADDARSPRSSPSSWAPTASAARTSGRVTIAHLLTHRAALVPTPTPVPYEQLGDLGGRRPRDRRAGPHRRAGRPRAVLAGARPRAAGRGGAAGPRRGQLPRGPRPRAARAARHDEHAARRPDGLGGPPGAGRRALPGRRLARPRGHRDHERDRRRGRRDAVGGLRLHRGGRLPLHRDAPPRRRARRRRASSRRGILDLATRNQTGDAPERALQDAVHGDGLGRAAGVGRPRVHAARRGHLRRPLRDALDAADVRQLRRRLVAVLDRPRARPDVRLPHVGRHGGGGEPAALPAALGPRPGRRGRTSRLARDGRLRSQRATPQAGAGRPRHAARRAAQADAAPARRRRARALRGGRLRRGDRGRHREARRREPRDLLPALRGQGRRRPRAHGRDARRRHRDRSRRPSARSRIRARDEVRAWLAEVAGVLRDAIGPSSTPTTRRCPSSRASRGGGGRAWSRWPTPCPASGSTCRGEERERERLRLITALVGLERMCWFVVIGDAPVDRDLVLDGMADDWLALLRSA